MNLTRGSSVDDHLPKTACFTFFRIYFSGRHEEYYRESVSGWPACRSLASNSERHGMDRARKIRDELAAAAQQAARGVRLVVSGAGGRAEVELAACDPLGCAVLRLHVDNASLTGKSVGELAQLATQLAGRLTYLLEPVCLIEADADLGAVQIRSNPPQRDTAGTAYYELLGSTAGAWELRRYQKTPSAPRQQVAAVLTHEVVVRLVDDLVATC